MALIEKVDLDPGRDELRKFGYAVCVLFGVLGGYIRWKGGLPIAAFPDSAALVSLILWILGAASLLFSLVAPALNQPLFILIVLAGYPIGIVVSFLLLALMFLGLVVPIGLLFKILGRDPLTRKRAPDAKSHWVDHKQVSDPSRYLKQF